MDKERRHIMDQNEGEGAGKGREGKGRAGKGRAGQGRAGQGRAGQGREGICNLLPIQVSFFFFPYIVYCNFYFL